jgi:alkylation response protein AidB-like acyl-CoA dehydrogenase
VGRGALGPVVASRIAPPDAEEGGGPEGGGQAGAGTREAGGEAAHHRDRWSTLMDFDLPGDDHPTRRSVREWIADNPRPSGRTLAEAGYVVPHWPRPWGLDADPIDQLVIDDELSRAGIRRPNNHIGIGWAAPTIFLAGTPEQHERYLPKIFSGEEFWCQLFSEPDAGSDLANLGTRAVRDGDEYVVNGSKIWSSGAHHAQLGILIARTDPDQPKHKGISYFICPMDLPGITMSPIVDMTTAHSFNQVFFDDVRIPASLRVGEENDGWRLAKVTLSNERVSLSSAGSLWGVGPSADDLLHLARCNGGIADPVLRDQAACLYIEAELLRLNRMRSLSARLQGKTPGPEASIQKIMADEHGQHVMALAKALSGADGMLAGSGPAGELASSSQNGPTENNFKGERPFPDVDPIWHYGYLFGPALTLGGGTFAVQRNIVAEFVLGLPREPNLEKGLTWSEARHLTAG